MRTTAGATAAAVALLALPAAAHGATVSLTPPDYELDEIFALGKVEDDRAERNDLVVDGRRYGRFVVRERGAAPLRAGRGCTQRSADVVKCGPIDEIVAISAEAGDGDDAVRCRGQYGQVLGGPGDDTLAARDGCRLDLAGQRGDDELLGGRRTQWLIGGSGRDLLEGGPDNDRLYGDGVGSGHGRDALDGGEGVDVVVFAGEQRGVRIDLSRGRGPDRDSLTRIEHIIGTRKDDVLVGDSGRNKIRGGGGDGRDRLDGRGGNDVLEEAAHVRCGTGRDVVRYPGSALLRASCELMWDFQYLDFERVPIFPRATGERRIAVPAVCNGTIEKCRHKAIVGSRGVELGRSKVVPSSRTSFTTWVPVRLDRPLPRRRPVRIETYTQEYDPLEADEGESPWSGFIDFHWRIRCSGGPDCRGPG